MAEDTRATGATGLSKLRKVLSWSIDRNIALERQLEESQDKESRLLLDELAAHVVSAVRQTEEAMGLVSEGTSRYAVSQIVVSVKGFVDRTDDGIALKLVRTEQKIKPELLSSITLTLARTPSAEPTAGDKLVKALEEAQAAFDSWRGPEGVKEARDLLARATHLVSARDAWQDILPAGARALAEAAVRFAGLAKRPSTQTVRDLKGAAAALQRLAKDRGAAPLDPAFLEGLASAIHTIAARFLALAQGR